MDTNKHIAKALLNKSFAEAKELVFKSLYAKASLALDEARFAVANGVFNEAKKTTGVPAGASEDKFAAAREDIKKAGHKAKLGKGVPAGRVQEEAELDEMAQTADRARQMRKVIKTRTATAAKHADDAREVDFYGQDNSREAARAAHSDRLLAQAKIRNAREKASKKTYGAGGKVVKEESEQIDELSKKTLGSYVRKAASDIEDQTADATRHHDGMGEPGTDEKELAATRNKIKARHKGISRAVKRLVK